MTPDKLEALRKLAADERTPIEEARNAALAYVRGGGERPAIEEFVPREELTRAMSRNSSLQNRVMDLEALAKRNQDERGRATAERDKLRAILTKLLDTRKAEELAASVRAQAEQEAREAVGYGEKNASCGESETVDPFWGNRPRRGYGWFDPTT